MADEWQLKAVHEQFRSLEKRKEYTESNLIDSRESLNSFLISVLNDHLDAPIKLFLRSKVQTSATNIISQIVKAVNDWYRIDGKNNEFTISFIVIVTNQKTRGGLSKIPVFFVEAGNKCVYIDMTSSLYKSWNAFLKCNDLPPNHEFCYPVDGKYSSSRKLKINYAKSPASKYSTVNLPLPISDQKEVSALSVAESFFFKICKCTLYCVEKLIPIALKWIPILLRCLKCIGNLFPKVQMYKQGKIPLVNLIQTVFQVLGELDKIISQKDVMSWKEIKQVFGEVCAFISEEFGFGSKSYQCESQVLYNVLALTNKVDSELKTTKKNADKRVHESTITKDTISPQSSYGEIKDQTVQDILEKQKEDYENSRRGRKELSKETCDLVTVSAKIVKHIDGPYQRSIHAETFETLSDTVKKSYQDEVDRYLKVLRAAEKGAGHKIDLEAFNKELGIVGDYKEHFWNKCLSKNCSKLGEEIKMKLKQLQSNGHITLRTIAPENPSSLTGGKLFMWKSSTEINEKVVLFALREEIGLDIKESDLVINNYTYNIAIRSEKYSIFVHKKDQHAREGLMLVYESVSC